MPMIQDTDLADVLTHASCDDIGLLIDVITDSGKGRISLSSSTCRQLSAAKDREITEYERGLVAEELTRFGGNSLMNVFRGGNGVPYKELLNDVASHVGVAKSGLGNCEIMEMAIISKVVEQSVGRMSEADKVTFFESIGSSYRTGMGPGALAALLASLSASNAYSMAAVVANATMSSLVGRGDGRQRGFGPRVGCARRPGRLGHHWPVDRFRSGEPGIPSDRAMRHSDRSYAPEDAAGQSVPSLCETGRYR